jgi:hypothetical protein
VTITPVQYLNACKRRFGNANPQRMHEPVWEWMIREGHNPYAARRALGLESDYGPCGLPNNPDWCFQRMGMPEVALPDGRHLFIAGEHEDFYDPDFCIYNDVIERRGDEIAIFGYPRDVFPPTDFHTATLIGESIWLVGSIGYSGERAELAQVLVLDSATYEVRSVRPTGDSPGWLSHHRARLLEDGRSIEVWGGDLIPDAVPRRRKNIDTFRLDTRTLTWARTSDTSAWAQYLIEYEEEVENIGRGRNLGWYTGEILHELGLRVEPARDPEDSDRVEPIHTVWLGDVPVRIEDRFRELYVVIEGAVPESDRRSLVARLKALMESTGRTTKEILEL